ncbi:MAG: hypothetical protein R3F62_07530 [Planctomycetota bacterium]
MTRKRSERLEVLTRLRVSEEAERQSHLVAVKTEQAQHEDQLLAARDALRAAEDRLALVLGQPALDLHRLQRARADLEALHQRERDLRLKLRDVSRRVSVRQRELEHARVARRAAEELCGRASSEERILEGRGEARASDEAAVMRWEGGGA